MCVAIGEDWPGFGWAAWTESGSRDGGMVYQESVKEDRRAQWRFPYRMEICKSNAITRGSVPRIAAHSAQNGLTTTSSTIAIIRTVGNSLTTL